MDKLIQIREFKPTITGYPIIGLQSPQTRAINVGYIEKTATSEKFIPGRLNFGGFRIQNTYDATVQSLKLPQIKKILAKFKPEEISTITLLRETLACNLPLALSEAGIPTHYGDCYIGANHIKSKDSIKTNYAYENVEGLNPNGLWILADSIAEGRNLIATLTSLLSKYQPKYIILIVPIGNRLGINLVAEVLKKFNIPGIFIVWGALFGLEPTMHYDEPWGLPECEPIDPRDQKTFVDMYSSTLCMGGDFGNDFYCPPLALELYNNQLKQFKITPKIPSTTEILKIYKPKELVIHKI
jgi:hypothetical protein